ncbi:MAG: di-heme oxidoredictase family protein [Planctomycetota bacterium]
MTKSSLASALAAALRIASVGALAAAPAAGQYNERPDLVGSGSPAVDASGRSIKNKRTRAIHTTDPGLPGGTAYFFERDPFLAYQLGRNLNFREFRSRDGVFDDNVSGLAGPMPDGTTAKITANNHTSCSGCHNVPQGNAGGGTNFHKDSGPGRQTPHYYGAGIIEMLALQVRADLLALLDTDASGWVSAAEAQAGPQCIVQTSPGGKTVDFGSPQLSGGSIGSPSFDNIVRVWYVDAAGKHVPDADSIDGVTTFGYNFELVIWGWGQGPGRAALNPTNRAFFWDPAKAHSGLDSFDPTTSNDPDGDGVSEPSLAGALQFPATHVPGDNGTALDPLGFSLDDPDGDGYLTEISEGDLDLAEWFMLNAPRPAYAGSQESYEAGVASLDALGCTVCHVPDWEVKKRSATHAGDRRFFDLDVSWNDGAQRLEGDLVPLYTKSGGSYQINGNAFLARGVFSDLRHHDMGDGFRELDFAGFQNTVWRTPPLWGVGSGFPWGHDGRSLTLEDAILRHDGEGAASKAAWLGASERTRAQVLRFLQRLVLYDVESLPADIDGDGTIAPNFAVAGMDTGPERFNAEWLFRNPLRIQGPVTVDGQTIQSFAGTNVDRAYGHNLYYRKDSDDDGWPDVWDNAPGTTGYRDGVQ